MEWLRQPEMSILSHPEMFILRQPELFRDVYFVPTGATQRCLFCANQNRPEMFIWRQPEPSRNVYLAPTIFILQQPEMLILRQSELFIVLCLISLYLSYCCSNYSVTNTNNCNDDNNAKTNDNSDHRDRSVCGHVARRHHVH